MRKILTCVFALMLLIVINGQTLASTNCHSGTSEEGETLASSGESTGSMAGDAIGSTGGDKKESGVWDGMDCTVMDGMRSMAECAANAATTAGNSTNLQAGLESTLLIDYRDMSLKNALDVQYQKNSYTVGLGLDLTASWMPSHISQTFKLDLDELFVEKDFKYGGLLLGRKRLEWGPGYFSGLVLSKTSPSLDLAGYNLKYHHFTYQRFYSLLEAEGNKQLQGHRLETDIIPHLILGVSETAVTYGKIDALFYNPFPGWPLYLSQHIVTRKDVAEIMERVNIAMSGDFKYTFSDGTNVYGEMYIDDAPMHVVDNVVDKRGGLAGYYNPHLTANTDLRIEYARIHNYVYSHRAKLVDYTKDGVLLGHISGLDSDMLAIESTTRLNEANKLKVGLMIHQQGEGRLDVDWGDDPNWRENKFLSGVVEKTFTLSAGINNYRGERENYGFTVSVFHTDNYQHKVGASDEGFRFAFSKKWSLR